MYNYDSQIKKFRHEKVTLPSDMRAMLLAHRKANADRIIARLPDFHDKVRVGETNFKSQGSFAMDTVIQTRFDALETAQGQPLTPPISTTNEPLDSLSP